MALARSLGRRLFWALTWGTGVAIGVAAGGWLTIVGGQGAPGTESLDFVSDLVIIPLAAGSVVTVLHIVVTGVIAGISRTRPRDRDGGDDERE